MQLGLRAGLLFVDLFYCWYVTPLPNPSHQIAPGTLHLEQRGMIAWLWPNPLGLADGWSPDQQAGLGGVQQQQKKNTSCWDGGQFSGAIWYILNFQGSLRLPDINTGKNRIDSLEVGNRNQACKLITYIYSSTIQSWQVKVPKYFLHGWWNNPHWVLVLFV